MADKYAPVLSQSSAQPFISPGVTNNIGSSIAAIGKIGVDAYTGYQSANLQKDIQAEAEQFFATQKEDYRSADAMKLGSEVAGLEEGTNTFFQQMPDNLEGIKGLDRMNQALESKLSSYASAVRQGRMSIGELQTRILSKTREAINQNPFLQRELLQTADKFMEISGLGSWLKAQTNIQEDQAKAQQKMLENLDAEGRERDIPGWFNMSTQQKMESIDLVRKREYTVKEAEAMTKSGAFVDRQTMLEWRDTGKLDHYFNGNLDQLNVVVHKLFQDNNTDNYANVQKGISDAIAMSKQDFLKNIPVSIRNEPEIKQQIADYDKFTGEMERRMKELGSGANAREAWGNLSANFKAQQDVALRRQLNPEKWELFSKIFTAFPTTILGEGNLEKIKGISQALVNNLFESGIVQGSLPTAAKPDKTLSSVLGTAAQVSNKEKDPSTVKAILKTFNEGIPTIKDASSRSIFIQQNLQELAKADLTGLDTEGIDGVNKMIGSFLDDKQFGLRSMFANMLEKSPTVDVLEDGRLVFTGNEAAAFNGAYGAKINTALEAYAKAQGLTTKAAAPRFYKNYFTKYDGSANIVGDKDLVAPKGNASEQALRSQTSDLVPEAPNQASINELEKEIAKATSPAIKAILIAEYNKIKDQISNPQQVVTKPLPGMEQARMNMAALGPAPQNLEELKKAQQMLPDNKDVPVVTSKALLEGASAPTSSSASPAKLKDITPAKKGDLRPSVQQESMDIAVKALQKFNSKYKTSPLLKRDPKTDAIESSGVDQVLLEGLNEVHPAAGMAAGAALVALGGVQAIPSLAKYMPKLLATAGKVTTTSNVTVAGANSGAQAAIVNSILNTAAKTKKTKMEALYKEYWSKGWQKDMVELPKNDNEWSMAITRANEYVAEKIKPSTLNIPKRGK